MLYFVARFSATVASDGQELTGRLHVEFRQYQRACTARINSANISMRPYTRSRDQTRGSTYLVIVEA